VQKEDFTMRTVLPALSTPRYGVQDDFSTLRQEVDRWFDRFFDRGNGSNVQGNVCYAPISVWEDGNHVYVEAELPGVSKDDLELTVLNGQLHLAAVRKLPEEQRQYWHNERRFGRFERVIYLSETIDPDTIQAELHDGILCVTLSKKPEAQPKRISVKAG
jgi:HSP20 family protein